MADVHRQTDGVYQEARLTGGFALDRIAVRGFRNLADTVLVPQSRMIGFSGDNGAGKTNLLEAVSLIAPGRGLRGAPLADLARLGSGTGWRIQAEVQGPVSTSEIVVGGGARQPDHTGDSRKISVDGKPTRGHGTLDHHIRMIWLTPALDRLFAGPAQERRRHFDAIVATLDPVHRRRLAAYERTMRERNRVLAHPRFDPAWVDGLDWQLAELAVALAAARLQAADSLAATMKAMRPVLAELSFPHADLAIDGEIEALLDRYKAVEVEDICRTMLGESREADRRAGRMLHGPHRSDLKVWHGTRARPARLCSTGEKKALLIAMTLAHARAITATLDGLRPVLLIDEVAAHLDPVRRDGLFDYLNSTGAQVWMTGTSDALFANLGADAQIHRVADGAVAGPV